MSNLHTALINFQSSKLLTAYDESTGKTYVALKPIVEGMGLDWKSQHKRLQRDSRWGVITLPFLTRGGTQEMLSLDTDHLPAFLYSINPNRVRKDLRDRIIAFQTETFAVINAYWRKKTRQSAAMPARIGELEQRIYMLKRENTELKRAINRLTYNQKQTTQSKRKIFIDDNGNEIDLNKLWNRGVFPYIPRAAKELREKIAKELGSVGHVYQAKLLEIERLFSAKPLRIGNGVIVGSVMFPDAMLDSRPETDAPMIGR